VIHSAKNDLSIYGMVFNDPIWRVAQSRPPSTSPSRLRNERINRVERAMTVFRELEAIGKEASHGEEDAVHNIEDFILHETLEELVPSEGLWTRQTDFHAGSVHIRDESDGGEAMSVGEMTEERIDHGDDARTSLKRSWGPGIPAFEEFPDLIKEAPVAEWRSQA